MVRVVGGHQPPGGTEHLGTYVEGDTPEKPMKYNTHLDIELCTLALQRPLYLDALLAYVEPS